MDFQHWQRAGLGSCLAMAVAAAQAQALPNASESSAPARASVPAAAPWHVQITPYVWATGMGGTVRPIATGPTAHVSESFMDVLKDLDAAFFLNGLVRYRQAVVHLDMTYASLSKSAQVELAPGLRLQGSAKLRQRVWSALGGYHWQASQQSSWDWLVGVRNWGVRAAVQAGVPGVGARSVSMHQSFTYPVVAARWRYQWDPRWSTLAYVDVGGRGSGNRTGQAMLTVNYALQSQWYVSAGYRYLHVSRDRGGMLLDLEQHGPVLGVTYRF